MPGRNDHAALCPDAKNFTNLSDVPDTGTCAVLSATGAYAGLHGSGKLTGSANFIAATLTDTLLL